MLCKLLGRHFTFSYVSRYSDLKRVTNETDTKHKHLMECRLAVGCYRRGTFNGTFFFYCKQTFMVVLGPFRMVFDPTHTIHMHI